MANDKYDSQIFMMKTISFMRIFLIIIYVIKNYSKELICSFKVWWTSIAGQLSLEWSVSDFSRQLYEDLVLYIKQHQIKPLQQLHISLLYDDCVFVKNNTTSYSAILPTKHFLLIIEMLLLHYRHVFTLLSITITQIKN